MWKFVKMNFMAGVIIVMICATFGFIALRPESKFLHSNPDCLSGYQEIYFGQGAYECVRSKDVSQNLGFFLASHIYWSQNL